MSKIGLDHTVLQILTEHGYKMIQKIGEGHTREVYEVEYQREKLCKRRVVKVPKTEISPFSVTTRINLSKGDPDEREVVALNGVSHPNIIEIYDVIKWGTRTITIEEFYGGISLERFIQSSGPLKDRRLFQQIFSQVLRGLQHFHVQEGLLHNDIKPTNILVGEDYSVKIIDFQNAHRLQETTESYLPTHGGTAFTDPSLLNVLLTGEQSRTSLQNEFYALGATMYYALTGEVPFDYSLVTADSGKVVPLGNETIKVVLLESGKPIERIDLEKHEEILQLKLEQIPKFYRKLLWDCLSSQRKYSLDDPVSAHKLFGKDFERATTTRKLPRYAYALATLALVAGVGEVYRGWREKPAGYLPPEIGTGRVLEGITPLNNENGRFKELNESERNLDELVGGVKIDTLRDFVRRNLRKFSEMERYTYLYELPKLRRMSRQR